MDPKTNLLIVVLLMTCFAIRGTYIYIISWKWNLMIMSWLEYKDLYFGKEIVKGMADQAYEIPRVRWLFWKVWLWDKAEDCYISSHNPRMWFEITSHWYDNLEKRYR